MEERFLAEGNAIWSSDSWINAEEWELLLMEKFGYHQVSPTLTLFF